MLCYFLCVIVCRKSNSYNMYFLIFDQHSEDDAMSLEDGLQHTHRIATCSVKKHQLINVYDCFEYRYLVKKAPYCSLNKV